MRAKPPRRAQRPESTAALPSCAQVDVSNSPPSADAQATQKIISSSTGHRSCDCPVPGGVCVGRLPLGGVRIVFFGTVHLQMCAHRRYRQAQGGWLDIESKLQRRRPTAECSVWARERGWALRWRETGCERDSRFHRSIAKHPRIGAIFSIAELGVAGTPYSFCKDQSEISIAACHDSAGRSGMVVSSGCITAVVPGRLMRKSGRSPAPGLLGSNHHGS